MQTAGTIELDLHAMNVHQARIALDAALRRANGAYRIYIIHGENRGTALKELIYTEYSDRPGVLRLASAGRGRTELVLREL